MQQTLDDWSSLLQRIKTVEPKAHIAGGAVRDLLNGRTIKDIDIFVPAETDMSGIARTIESTHPFLTRITGGGYIPGADPVVTETYEYRGVGQTPLNFVLLLGGFDIEMNMRRFDFGLCQAAFDGQHIIKSGDYLWDVLNCTFTLTRCDNYEQFSRSLQRYERWQSRYSGWPMVVPEQFQQFDTRVQLEAIDA